MNRFVKILFKFFCPFILLLMYYLIVDPFYVVWRFRSSTALANGIGCCNDALRGIQWMNMQEDSLHYNSFIIGSSRSDFYYVDEWKKYLDDDAVCFHFNQSGDNLQGTLERIQYLHKRFDKIDNILFVMDREYLEDMSHHKGHLFRNPWQVTSEWDFFAFHWEFIKAFLTIEYQRQLFRNEIDSNTLTSHYDARWNEAYKDGAEEMLNTGRYNEYYSRFHGFYALYPRDMKERVACPVIKHKQYAALLEIYYLLCEWGGVDYKVVISPLYDQENLNPIDVDILRKIFGENNVFDYSGINDITNDSTNYYETSHYRPIVCNKILEQIYDRL